MRGDDLLHGGVRNPSRLRPRAVGEGVFPEARVRSRSRPVLAFACPTRQPGTSSRRRRPSPGASGLLPLAGRRPRRRSIPQDVGRIPSPRARHGPPGDKGGFRRSLDVSLVDDELAIELDHVRESLRAKAAGARLGAAKAGVRTSAGRGRSTRDDTPATPLIMSGAEGSQVQTAGIGRRAARPRTCSTRRQSDIQQSGPTQRLSRLVSAAWGSLLEQGEFVVGAAADT